MVNTKIEVYAQVALSQVPRILGLENRDPQSSTSGCFDRYYWHYRLVDFSNARFQEAALLLALLSQHDFPRNRYYGHERVREWAIGGIEFWSHIQRRDGSFDEAYPNEHSFVATAFTTYAITEAMLLLDKPCRLSSIEKAGNWLVRNENLTVANQMAGAAVALYNVFLLTDIARYRLAATEKIHRLLAGQNNEGFFPEYGGFDIGYLTICISYLAKYWKKTKDSTLRLPLERAVRFVAERLRDDGSYDNSMTSRRTQYLYPHGFVVAQAKDVIAKHCRGVAEGLVVNPAWMDDRFCIPLTVDYLQAYLEGMNRC